MISQINYAHLSAIAGTARVLDSSVLVGTTTLAVALAALSGSGNAAAGSIPSNARALTIEVIGGATLWYTEDDSDAAENAASQITGRAEGSMDPADMARLKMLLLSGSIYITFYAKRIPS